MSYSLQFIFDASHGAEARVTVNADAERGLLTRDEVVGGNKIFNINYIKFPFLSMRESAALNSANRNAVVLEFCEMSR